MTITLDNLADRLRTVFTTEADEVAKDSRGDKATRHPARRRRVRNRRVTKGQGASPLFPGPSLTQTIGARTDQ